MSVDVLFFADIREKIGFSSICVEVQRSITKEDFLTKLKVQLGVERFACLEEDNVSIALNQELQKGTFFIRSGDEIAFMPPITGG